MKDFRFYLEYESTADKRRGTRKALGQHTGNVIAVDSTLRSYYTRGGEMIECYSGTFSTPNSPACWTSANREYLHKKCRRISEAQAREIHPLLFVRMEA